MKQRKALVKALSKKRVSNTAYRNGYVSLKFDGRRLRNKVIMKHDPGLGDWRVHGHGLYAPHGTLTSRPAAP